MKYKNLSLQQLPDFAVVRRYIMFRRSHVKFQILYCDGSWRRTKKIGLEIVRWSGAGQPVARRGLSSF